MRKAAARIVLVSVLLVLVGWQSSCRLIGYNRFVDNQPLSNPIPVVFFQNTGVVTLANGKSYQIAGIQNINPLVNSWEDVKSHLLASRMWPSELRDEIEVVPLYSDPTGKEYTDIFVARAYPFGLCGTYLDPMYIIRLFPKDYPRYLRTRLADLLLYPGLCTINPEIIDTQPTLYKELKYIEDCARWAGVGIWSNTHCFRLRLQLMNENGAPVKSRNIIIETIPTTKWTSSTSDNGQGIHDVSVSFNKEDLPKKIIFVVKIDVTDGVKEILRKEISFEETENTRFTFHENLTIQLKDR